MSDNENEKTLTEKTIKEGNIAALQKQIEIVDLCTERSFILLCIFLFEQS